MFRFDDAPRTPAGSPRPRRLASSLIDRIVFDDGQPKQLVQFRNARRHLYRGVPRTVYDAPSRAASADSVFNDRVRGRFPCEPADRRRRYPLAD